MKKECKLTDHRVGHDWRDLAAAAAGKVEDFKDRASCIHCGELFPKEDSLKQKERDSRMPGAKLDVYLQSRA